MTPATTSPTKETFQDILANRIASAYYEKLLAQIRTVLADQFRGRDVERLRKHALRQWHRTADNAKPDQVPVRQHILKVIIPAIECSPDLIDQTFLLFFFVDGLTGRKRFWCPTDEALLTRLGWPYNSAVATHGTAGVPGLQDWDVPLTSVSRRGLKGTLEHQYLVDLTEDQFANKTFNPPGDWLVGIKSAVYLGIPPETAAREERLGQLCVCSPIPFLFGDVDITKETDADAEAFFRPYAAIVNQTEEATIRSFSSYFDSLARDRQGGANEVARNWIYQTIGLTHKHRMEARQIAEDGPNLVEQFLSAVERHPALGDILDALQQERCGLRLELADLRRELNLIRETERSRYRFYEFLNRFGYRALGRRDERDTEHDPNTPKTAEAFADKIRTLSDQIRVIHSKSLPDIIYALDKAAFRFFGGLDWGAFEFIWHQLLENAADKGQKAHPIEISIALNSTGEYLLLSAKNRLRLKQIDRSKSTHACVHNVARYIDFRGEQLCHDCYIDKVKAFFDGGQCWDPSANGYRFGLFMIRHFIREFYGGSAWANTSPDGNGIAVTFTLSVPTRREA